jgi:glycosyltransferase involved in cell wall biosynthesis
MIVDGDTGTLVPPQDAAALADAVATIVLDAGMRRRMSDAARRRSIEQFSLQAHGRRLLAHYDALQASGAAAPDAKGEVA